MTADTVAQTLKTILARDMNLNIAAHQIRDDHPLMAGGLDLDSIAIVELIGLVEERFSFQFEDTDLRTATFESLRTLAEVITRRVNN